MGYLPRVLFFKAMEDNEEEEGEERASDEPADDLGQTIADARRDCETQKEREKFDQILERRWSKKAGYHIGIVEMEGRGRLYGLGIWKVVDSSEENASKE